MLFRSVRGTDTHVYTDGFNGSTWGGWVAAPGGATESAPALTTYNGAMYVSVRGTDDHVYTGNWS